jgi:hypothetical protein
VTLSRPVVSMCVLAGVVALAARALAADDPPLPPELIAAPPKSLHSRMDYGSHAGMQVSILGMEGRDTAHAVIRFAHTRDNAISYCRDSLSTVTEQCVQDALDVEKGFKDSLTGNCDTGEFSDFFGGHYRFEGRNPKSGYFGDNKYLIVNLADGEIADGSEMSRYLINLSIYRALCPAHAPVDIDATIVSMAGRDTAKAIIKVRHTREDAIHSCQESGIIPVQQVSEDCIRQELAKRVSDVVTADCERGEFRDYYGDRFRVSLNTSQAYPASLFKANITNLATGRQFDRVMADSKAHQPMPVYHALCPAHAPLGE